MSFLTPEKPKTIATRDLADEQAQKAARSQADRTKSIRGETLLTAGLIPTPGMNLRATLGGA